MDTDTKTRSEDRAATMAHPNILFLLVECSKGERCVGGLTKMVGQSTSTVSNHRSFFISQEAANVTQEGSRCMTDCKSLTF